MAVKKSRASKGKDSQSKRLSYVIPAKTTKSILARLDADKRVRRTLPGWGRLHIDRQLPFLAVYRRRDHDSEHELERLVSGEAAYLWATAKAKQTPEIQGLLSSVSEVMQELFGAFLLLEIWPARHKKAAAHVEAHGVSRPHFRVIVPKGLGPNPFVDRFVEALSRIRLQKQRAHVEVVKRTRIAPEHLAPLLTQENNGDGRQVAIGLEFDPIFLDPETGEMYPELFRRMARRLSRALKRLFYEFAKSWSTHKPPHFHALGRRAMVRAVWTADKNLSEVSDQFDFLLQVSPVNGKQAWEQFRRAKFSKKPVFHYRPLPIDPLLLKRKLFATPVDAIEDPAIGELLREKMIELDRQLTMLGDRDTPAFLPGSIQLCGPVEEELRDLAESMMKAKLRSRRRPKSTTLSAQAFAQRAREEIDFLSAQAGEISTKVTIHRDLTGLMVSQGALLIGSELKVPGHRVEALIQHEVGTHVLTWANGNAQPFRQLQAGLPGYEALQEGLAVFAEYLVGGLDAERLRLLALRVLASGALVDGLGFVECFEMLHEQYGMAPRSAFFVTMRVFRGGGLNKDAIYLRGLTQVLEILQSGIELEDLLLGKISADQIPLMRELRWRKIIVPSKWLPGYLDRPDSQQRLALAKGPITVMDLLDLQASVSI